MYFHYWDYCIKITLPYYEIPEAERPPDKIVYIGPFQSLKEADTWMNDRQYALRLHSDGPRHAPQARPSPNWERCLGSAQILEMEQHDRRELVHPDTSWREWAAYVPSRYKNPKDD